RVRRTVESDRGHLPDVGNREGVPDVLERSWISRLTVASANDSLVVPAERESDARQELTGSRFNTTVKRHSAHSSSDDLARGRIEQVYASVIFSRHAKQFPAQAVGESYAAANLPVVASVECVLLPPD